MFGDDAGDEGGWCHIEDGIPTFDAWSGYPMIANVCHLPIGPFLDDDVIASRDVYVDGGQGSGHIEGHLMLLGH